MFHARCMKSIFIIFGAVTLLVRRSITRLTRYLEKCGEVRSFVILVFLSGREKKTNDNSIVVYRMTFCDSSNFDPQFKSNLFVLF